MEWIRRENASPVAAVLPAAFNPPTRAHVALAEAALDHAGEVVLILPRVLPHKDYEGPGFAERLDLLRAVAAVHPRFSVAACEGGLFLEIAREMRAADPRLERLLFLCGRDAAERAVTWDYRGLPPIHEQLSEYELLVAPRGGFYRPPPELRARVHDLFLAGSWDGVSSSDVRERIRRNNQWEQCVPPVLIPRLPALYGA